MPIFLIYPFSCQVGETGGSETPTSRTYYSRFPPPSEGVPASLFYSYWKMLRNIAKFFPFSPGSRHFGNPASRPSSSRLPYNSRPLFSRAPALLSPSTVNEAPVFGSKRRIAISMISSRRIYEYLLCISDKTYDTSFLFGRTSNKRQIRTRDQIQLRKNQSLHGIIMVYF